MADSLLAEADWTTREQAHRRRVEEFLGPHLRRAQTGEAHPVWDFLFRYYSLRPRQLRVWNPGFGVVLGGPDSGAARRYLGRTGYGPHPAGVTVSVEHLRARADTVRFIAGAVAGNGEPLRPDELLRTARVGDGVPGADTASSTRAAEAWCRRNRCGGGVNAVAVQPFRCVPVLHRACGAAQRRQPDARRPVRLGATGLCARQYGLVQMVLQTGTPDRV